MSEIADTIRLANKIISRPNADPDDDLTLMARQFLRAREVIEKQEKALQEVDWNGIAERDLIAANRDQLLKMHEEAIRRIHTALVNPKGVLARSSATGDDRKMETIHAIIVALWQFHPMHDESWCGWPETFLTKKGDEK